MNLLQGMSGCRLDLTKDGNLRKYSSVASYNHRLIAQAKKQDLFSKITFRNLYVPKVVGLGEEDGIFFFEMEYVSGLCLKEFIVGADKDDLDFLLETLCSYIATVSQHFNLFDAKREFISKAEDLLRKSSHQDFLAFLIDLIKAESELLVPKTICHGDLTLSNLIFQKNRLFFIDFLDSYVETFFCDLAKIKQDLFYMWTPITGGYCDLRAQQSLSYLWAGVEDRFGKEMESMSFKVVDALNILRIEPYIKRKTQADAMNAILEKNHLYEDFNRSNGG